MADAEKLTEADYFAEQGASLGFPDSPLRTQKAYEFNMTVAQSSL